MTAMNEAVQFDNVGNNEAYEGGDMLVTFLDDGVVIYEQADDIQVVL